MRVGTVLKIAAALGALSLAMPSVAMGASPQGKQIFQSRCAMCHSTEAGVNKMGPSLANVVGRKAGEQPDFNYSSALKKSGVTWTPSTLDKWLTNPHQFVPGDRMPFPGLSSKDQRNDVIAYLQSLSPQQASRH